MDTLEGHVLGELDSMKEELNSFQDSIVANDERIARLDEATQAMRASIDAIQEDMVVCKRALASEASIGGGVSRVILLNPRDSMAIGMSRRWRTSCGRWSYISSSQLGGGDN